MNSVMNKSCPKTEITKHIEKNIFNHIRNIRVGLMDYWIIGLLDYWIIGLMD